MRRRIRVGVLFGGRSCEHEVSVRSARSVIGAIDGEKFDVLPIAVTKQGEWLAVSRARLEADGDAVPERGAPLFAPADGNGRGLPACDGASGRVAFPPAPDSRVDVVLPLIHGPMGEDGTVQGLLELAGVPYVGSGVLGSALGMDKAVTKALLAHHGLPVVRHRVVGRRQWRADPQGTRRRCEAAFPYPWFVKPANLGSSVGVSKVHGAWELADAMDGAAQYDRKLLVEEAVEDAREIEVGVLGNDDPLVSVPGEIAAASEFYDYAAKYLDDGTRLIVPAALPVEAATHVCALALAAFKAVDCAGLARVDFLVRRDDGEVFVSEINTLPGFTPSSMFPRLWAASGIAYAELVERLIELALARHEEKRQNRTSYLG